MTFVKYQTNNLFDNEGFVQMLEVRMNVRAMATEGGVVLDRDKFNAMPIACMPLWAYQNRRFINSDVHSIVLTPDKWPDVPDNFQYSLVLQDVDGGETVLESAPGYEYLCNECVRTYYAWKDEEPKTLVYVIDNTTGEVMFIQTEDY